MFACALVSERDHSVGLNIRRN